MTFDQFFHDAFNGDEEEVLQELSEREEYTVYGVDEIEKWKRNLTVEQFNRLHTQAFYPKGDTWTMELNRPRRSFYSPIACPRCDGKRMLFRQIDPRTLDRHYMCRDCDNEIVVTKHMYEKLVGNSYTNVVVNDRYHRVPVALAEMMDQMTDKEFMRAMQDPPHAALVSEALAKIAPAQSADGRKFAGLPVKSANKQSEWGMCIAVYGAAGVGKTTFAADIADSPLGGPAVILDAEGGARSVAHKDNVDIIDITSWQQVQAFTQEFLRTPNPPWRSVIWDNMSELSSKCLTSVMQQDQPQIQDYGKATTSMLAFTRVWRDAARSKGTNVVFIAWDFPEKDEGTGNVKYGIGFTPSLARQFPGIVDIIGYLSVANNPPLYTRVLNFAPSPRTVAKFRRSQTEVAQQIPYEIFYGMNEHPIVDLLATLKGGTPWPSDRYKAPARPTSPSK